MPTLKPRPAKGSFHSSNPHLFIPSGTVRETFLSTPPRNSGLNFSPSKPTNKKEGSVRFNIDTENEFEQNYNNYNLLSSSTEYNDKFRQYIPTPEPAHTPDPGSTLTNNMKIISNLRASSPIGYEWKSELQRQYGGGNYQNESDRANERRKRNLTRNNDDKVYSEAEEYERFSRVAGIDSTSDPNIHNSNYFSELERLRNEYKSASEYRKKNKEKKVSKDSKKVNK